MPLDVPANALGTRARGGFRHGSMPSLADFRSISPLDLASILP